MTAQELKNSILQLAVQGKLVPQCKEDEPASELMKHISAEKAKLGIKEKSLADITNDEIPFDIPENWAWAHLCDFCIEYFSGKSPVYSKEKNSFIIIGQAANQQGKIDYSQAKYSQKDFWDGMEKKYFLRKNDVLLNTLGHGTLGRSGIVKDINMPVLTDGHLFVFRTLNDITSIFLYYFLQYKRPEIEQSANGSTNQTFLSLTKTGKWLLPIPPLAEQKRIVAKIEELMPLVEEYGKAEEQLTKLNAEFPDKLRKSILQQAVQGKLTERDPADEPASELLKRIKKEKEALMKSGKIKKEKPLPEITEDEKPFDIPEQWCSVRIGDVGIYKKGPFGSSLTKSMFVPKSLDAVKVYEQKNAIQKDHTLGEYYIARDYFEKKMRGFEIFPGDIIVSCAGTIGETYVMPENIEQGIINQALMRMKIVPSIDLDYFLLYFDYVLKIDAQGSSKGSAIKNIPPFEIFKKMILPPPPLAEQKRIVKRVDELLALCDELK